MKFFAASRIHNGYGFLPEGSVLQITDDGTIVAVLQDYEGPDVKCFDGILCPGFVNVHTHLELSHLRGLIPEGTGLPAFLKAVTTQRAVFTEEEKKAARHRAYQELLDEGVVAVGDIGNTVDAMDLRARGQLHVHSFVECIGFTELGVAERFQHSLAVKEQLDSQQVDNEVMLRQTVTPHAPYSVSEALFRKISAEQPGALLSIHNQETPDENFFYQSGTGALKDLLEGFSIDTRFFSPSGKTSLQTYGEWLSPEHAVILVHNTCSTEADLQYARQRFRELHICLCPNANWYIERRLPDLTMLQRGDWNICIGTDSLSSNHRLSVLSELETLQHHYPELSWEQLLQWATLNGARALQMEETLGSFTPGKKPGIVQIVQTASGYQAKRVL